MSQDAVKYERLVALAGWLWMRLRDNRSVFRRADLAEVGGLDHFAGSGAASRKAFERAKDELGSFGVEVEWDDTATVDDDPDNTGAYRINRLGLTPEQRQALIGLAFTVAYRDLETDRRLRIPGAYLEGAGETLLLDANRHVAPTAEAIDERSCISFRYRDADDRREVQPVRLGYQRGTWYLAAHDFRSDTVLTFRVDQIHDLERTDTSWNDDLDTEDARRSVTRARDRFFWGEGETKEVVLAIDPDAELPARRLLGDLSIVGTDGGDRIVVSRPYSNDVNMLDAVLTLGRRAEILRPPELRSAIIDHLERMVSP